MLEPKDTTLERMHTLELHGGGEQEQERRQAPYRHTRCGRAPEQRLHVVGRVVERPGLLVDTLPLLLAHARMAGADMFKIVPIEVGIHRDAIRPELLMILRPWQRRQAEEFQHIDGKLALDDLD